MSGDRPRDVPGEQEPDWRRRRRLAEVFGETPQSSADERDPAEDRARESSEDRWLRDQVPPHHGG